MKIVDKVVKEKVIYTIKLDNISELNGNELKRLLPANAKNIEFEYKDKQGILIIDFISKFDIVKEF